MSAESKPVKQKKVLSEEEIKRREAQKEKAWDTPDIDKWKIVTIAPYREKYLKSVWGEVKGALKPFGIEAELDLTEGSMSVRTTRKTWDPYSILKARDLLKLLARSVPFPQAVKILEDEMHCDVMKISGLVRNKERFVKRRQRLVGPNGSTLKALEILTNCYILVQGQTVAMMGTHKGLKVARRIVEDCMNNIHPVYHIKELMIRKELEKDEQLKEDNWDRFLPQFKKKCVARKKARDAAKSGDKKDDKPKSLFPALPTPRKVDLAIESGEYFATEDQKKMAKAMEIKQREKEVSTQRAIERQKDFVAPKKERKLATI